MSLPCGHHRTCTFGYVHRGQRIRYCLACLIEKVGLPTIEEQRRELVKKEKKEIMAREEITEIADEAEARGEATEINTEIPEKKSLTATERMANARAAKKS